MVQAFVEPRIFTLALGWSLPLTPFSANNLLRLDQGIAGSVFQTQELVNIANCQQAHLCCLWLGQRDLGDWLIVLVSHFVRTAALTGPWTWRRDTSLGV